MRQNKGWFKLHRKLFSFDAHESLLYSKPQDKFIYIILIKNACFQDVKCNFGGKLINLSAGSLITSYKEITNETGYQTQKVRNSIKRLCDLNLISKKSNNQNSLITVHNYSRFQWSEQTTNKQLTNDQQTTNKQLTNERQTSDNIRKKERNKEEKKEEKKEILKKNKQKKDCQNQLNIYANEENNSLESNQKIIIEKNNSLKDSNKKIKSSLTVSQANTHEENKDAISSDLEILKKSEIKEKTTSKRLKLIASQKSFELAMLWEKWALIEMPHLKADVNKWSLSIERAMQKTTIYVHTLKSRRKLNHQDMFTIFEFIKKDNFWKTKASPNSLLNKGKNGQTKIVNILSSMKKEHNKSAELLEYARKIEAGEIKHISEDYIF